MATVAEMAAGTGELVQFARLHLRSLEEMTYRAGIEPGPDLAFAGVRIALAQAEEAVRFLRALVPLEGDVRALLDGRAPPLVANVAPAGTGGS